MGSGPGPESLSRCESGSLFRPPSIVIKVTVWHPRFGIAAAPGAARRFYVPARIWPSALQERKRSHRWCLGKRSEVERESEREIEREIEREMRQPNMAWRIPASRSEPAEVKLRRPEPWVDRIV